jgi:hypothetical protein
MKSKRIEAASKELKASVALLEKAMNASLRKFSKDNTDLEFFLFHTFPGEAFRDKLLQHSIDRILKKYVKRSSRNFSCLCASNEHPLRVLKAFSIKKTKDYFKSEFGHVISVNVNDRYLIFELKV